MLSADKPPTTRRTLRNLPLELATRRAGGGGTAVKALCWKGMNEVSVQQVPDPQIPNRQDALLKVRRSSVCGSDLHQISGYIPAMRAGDVIGHEFFGEIVTWGPRSASTASATGWSSAR